MRLSSPPPLFEGLSRKELVQLARVSEDVEVPPGKLLYKEGEIGEGQPPEEEPMAVAIRTPDFPEGVGTDMYDGVGAEMDLGTIRPRA